MARYRVQGPDGVVHVFEGPDNATPEQVTAFAEQTFKSRPAEKAPDPTEGMSTFDKVAAGVGKAVVDTGRGVAGLLGANNRADIEESRRLDAPLMNTGAGFAGNVGGNLLMAILPGTALRGAGAVAAGNALLAPTTVRGAAALGAGMGAVQPAIDLGERAQNIGLGGAAGAGGTALLQGLSRVVRPNTSPGVQALMAEGVTPTPGQILGGGWKRAEEGLTSVPLVGDAIKAGKTRAVEDLNAAAFNRALAPIGETLPRGLTGREAVAHVEEALGRRYDRLLPQLTTVADPQFAGEINSLRTLMANGSIDPTRAQQFESLLQNQVLSKFQNTANGPTLTGQTMKGIESDLRQLSSRFARSQDPDQQMVGDALREVQAALRGAVERSNPGQAEELRAINTGWANFKRVQRAASSVAAEDGMFSPAQLHNAVKAKDVSKDKGSFARGNALMQDLSETGKAVLGDKLPDSGTPYRMLASGGAGALAGGLLGGMHTAGLALAPMAVYSAPGQRLLAAALTQRPDVAVPAAELLRRLSGYAALPAAADMTTRR